MSLCTHISQILILLSCLFSVPDNRVVPSDYGRGRISPPVKKTIAGTLADFAEKLATIGKLVYAYSRLGDADLSNSPCHVPQTSSKGKTMMRQLCALVATTWTGAMVLAHSALAKVNRLETFVFNITENRIEFC